MIKSIFGKGGISSSRILLFIVTFSVIYCLFDNEITEGKMTILAGMFASLLAKVYLTDKNVK
jgi:hypothetical protein